ncbi:MAG: hypothetical protein H6Q69_5075 [Firmicutes bacterium]|nr:hypothetical protein [Bacillota bacterium]
MKTLTYPSLWNIWQKNPESVPEDIRAMARAGQADECKNEPPKTKELKSAQKEQSGNDPARCRRCDNYYEY